MPAVRGFLAMEYFLLILNRSFIVFTFPEGLYVSKFSGPVSSWTPFFFVPFEKIANDPDIVPGSEDFKDVMKPSGGFFIPRAEIASVDYVPTRKWGMGPVPHSGKLYVRLTSGKSREFILLGSQDGEAVRAAVLSGMPIAGLLEPLDQIEISEHAVISEDAGLGVARHIDGPDVLDAGGIRRQ
jgi:hypothetical protein